METYIFIWVCICFYRSAPAGIKRPPPVLSPAAYSASLRRCSLCVRVSGLFCCRVRVTC